MTEHTIYHADARDLSFVSEQSVHLVLTSPPYFNLKEYKRGENQLGIIDNYECFLDELEKVWKECYRILVPGGRIVCVVGDVCLSRRKYGRHVVLPLHSDIAVSCRKIGFDNLKEVEKCRNPGDNKSKSRWEKEFVDRVYKDTELLDLESYTNLNHLFDHRNFSAHPALNNMFELISPSRETTIAHIKNILEGILVKPPIFVKNVTNMLLDDLSEKKSIYRDEPEKLREYLNRKYFSRMSISMKKSTFRSLWKLCFCLPDDEDCQRNIWINRKALEYLFAATDGVLDYMKTDSMFTRTSPDDGCIMSLCILLAYYPQIYPVLSDDSKLQISALINKDSKARIISWFISSSKSAHIKELIKAGCYDEIDNETFDFVSYQYKLSGDFNCFIDYCIEYYGRSKNYNSADNRYRRAISPVLSEMTRDQFVRLITVINGNNQVYNRNASHSTNTEIVTKALPILGRDFDFEQYPHFSFDVEKVNSSIMDISQSNDSDENLPF